MTIKEVVEKAVEFIKQIYGETVSELMLEEVQLSDDNQKWLVTLSFLRERPRTSTTVAVFSAMDVGTHERVYKQVEIGAEKGEFIGMTIRKV